MSGTKSRLTALEARKHLLLAESEVNRVQLLHEWQCLEEETQALTQRARSFFSTVSSVASMGIAGFRAVRERTTRPNGKTSWLGTLFHGLKLGSSVWKIFRTRSD